MWLHRMGGISVVLVVVACAAPPAQANWLTEFLTDACSDTARDFKRRQCWPEPFTTMDRMAVREPFATMVANGWQRQNMVADIHFNGDTGQLTEAGRLKVLAILNESPEQHRVVFVHRGATPQETVARIQVVQQLVAQANYGGSLPPVLETTRPDDGWAADRVDATYRKYQAAVPEYKLGGGAKSK